jgi:hypothetical protein
VSAQDLRLLLGENAARGAKSRDQHISRVVRATATAPDRSYGYSGSFREIR